MKGTEKIGVLCLLLALLLVLSACGGKKTSADTTKSDSQVTTDQNGTETESDTVETDEYGQEVIGNDIPDDLKYDNVTVNIVMRPRDLWVREFGLEMQSDSVDNQVYYRNVAVENKLGVTMKITKKNELTSNALSKFVTASTLANTGDVDLVVGSAYFMTGAASKDCYADLNDSTQLKYLNLSKPWWNQNYINTAEIFGHLYTVVGDINLSVWDRTIVAFANLTQLTAIVEDDILDTVINHEWTVEKMLEIIKKIPFTETDGVEGATEGDKYALHSVNASEAWDGFFGAFRLTLGTKNDDGTYTLTIAENQKLSDASTLVNNFYKGDNIYLTKAFNDSFVNGLATFDIDVIYSGSDQNYKLRSMTDKYAILPLPMYDSTQTEYGATAQDTYNLMAVLNCSSVDLEMMSAFLEMMCSKSYEKVRPSYVEQMLKGKYIKEAKNVQIMEMIFDAVYFDPMIIYSNQLENIEHSVWRNPTKNGTNPLSAYESSKTAIDKALDDFQTWYMIK